MNYEIFDITKYKNFEDPEKLQTQSFRQYLIDDAADYNNPEINWFLEGITPVYITITQVENDVVNKLRILDAQNFPFTKPEKFIEQSTSIELYKNVYQPIIKIYFEDENAPFLLPEGIKPAAVVYFSIDENVEYNFYTIDTIDIMLGIIGGLFGLFWDNTNNFI